MRVRTFTILTVALILALGLGSAQQTIDIEMVRIDHWLVE
jgi:hypothetical protein